MKKIQHKSQTGAVSLFVVIFTTLLVTIVTVSFVQLMIKDQEQATTSDLSQSAYDSAMAGVEDAKRALLVYKGCETGKYNSARCSRVNQAIKKGDCDTLRKAGVINDKPGQTETPIAHQGGGSENADNLLDQAYTCVTIKVKTPDYKGNLTTNSSEMIPLKGTESFNKVKLSWFTSEDARGGVPASEATGPAPDVTFANKDKIGTPLPTASNWGSPTTPALMRFQLMQFGNGFSLDDFDHADDGKSNSSTLFLYPSWIGTSTADATMDNRRGGGSSNEPKGVSCENTFSDAIYACSVTIKLPDTLKSGTRHAYLRLGALYNQAHYSVQLYNGDREVEFDGAQPEIDVTGRANDLFRRVKARVKIKTAEIPYPEAALDISGSLCKNFVVTDDVDDYIRSNCTP